MAVGVFPALKLGVLFVKQISKPLAKFLVTQAKNHPVFRTYFIIPPAQFYHWAEVKAKMYIMNLGKPTKVAKLNEAMAIELGASLIGEVIIFSVAGGCVILEYNRQVAKEAKKEEARRQQLQKFTDDIENLNKVTSQQQAEILYLQNVLEKLGKHKFPIKHTTVEKNDSDGLHQPNEKEKMEAQNTEKRNSSLIERALVYYENNVKADRLS